MHRNKRKHLRLPVDYEVVFFWEDGDRKVCSTRPKALDISDQGLRVHSSEQIEPGTHICIELPRKEAPVEAIVKYCTPEGDGFRIGIGFKTPANQASAPVDAGMDFYEILQLSPKADMETIHRVYRIMAARFHPDNPDSGNQERFLLLSHAYRVLSDPARRARYDQMRGEDRPRPLPLFQAKAFVDEKEGEMHRRLGVMCLLYAQRRRVPEHPAIALMELEALMSIPREYLEFTLWYLKQKKYVQMDEGANFVLTADGVDFVEEHAAAQDILMKLLTSGSAREGKVPSEKPERTSAHVQ